MTAENLLSHDVSTSFSWDDKYAAQLQTLADTDEMTDDIRWPDLKDAIKHLLKQTFTKWPSSSSPILHPAAALITLHSSSVEDISSSSASMHGAANGNGAPINGLQRQQSAAHDKQHAASEEDAEGQVGTGNGAGGSLDLNSRFTRGAEDGGEGAATAGTGMQEQDISVKEADMQAFFPSKRQAPAEWRGSWGKRIDSEEELNREQRNIFIMLDDFEGQPPFTIQRLSELVLQPTEHHHTLPKYVSALKRLLSVTATRDAFPAHPGEDSEDQLDDVGAVGFENINGTTTPTSAGSRSRRATPVPGSPTTAPLFSPIPFLMRSGDEGMPGAGCILAGGLPGDGDVAMSDQDVPGMELGGADRTTEEAAEHAKRAGKGVGTHRGLTDALHQAEAINNVQSSDSAAESERQAPEPADGVVEKVESTSFPPSSVTQEQQTMGRAGELASSATTSSALSATSAPPATSEPLGVPAGPVDEVDQIGEKHGQLPPVEPGAPAGGARAFSSTTTAAPTPHAVTSSEASGAEEQPEASSHAQGTNLNDSAADSEPARALKRVRSERHLSGN